VVQDAWMRGQEVVVHGWVYGLHNGLIKDLSMTVASADALQAAYDEALVALKLRHPVS
jgi:carbonic anhydrase